MKYTHPKITVSEPSPGTFAIAGLFDGVGPVTAPGVLTIGPEVPSELLVAILDARGFNTKPAAPADEPKEPTHKHGKKGGKQ